MDRRSATGAKSTVPVAPHEVPYDARRSEKPERNPRALVYTAVREPNPVNHTRGQDGECRYPKEVQPPIESFAHCQKRIPPLAALARGTPPRRQRCRRAPARTTTSPRAMHQALPPTCLGTFCARLRSRSDDADRAVLLPHRLFIKGLHLPTSSFKRVLPEVDDRRRSPTVRWLVSCRGPSGRDDEGARNRRSRRF